MSINDVALVVPHQANLRIIEAVAKRAGAGPGATMGGKSLVKINPQGEVIHLRTKRPAQPRLLDGTAVKVADREDPRQALARSWYRGPGARELRRLFLLNFINAFAALLLIASTLHSVARNLRT